MAFHINVTFEMRTVLSGIRLFHDKSKVDAKGFYIKSEGREREQDSGDTKRERM